MKSPYRLLLALALFLPAGCTGAIESVDETLSNWADADCRSGRLLRLVPICQDYGSEDKRPPAAVAPAEPLYCYRTIGAVDCYSAPEPVPHRQTG